MMHRRRQHPPNPICRRYPGGSPTDADLARRARRHRNPVCRPYTGGAPNPRHRRRNPFFSPPAMQYVAHLTGLGMGNPYHGRRGNPFVPNPKTISQKKYWDKIRSVGKEIAKEAVAQAGSEDEARELAYDLAFSYASTSTGIDWMLYPAHFFDVLKFSDNTDAYFEETGETSVPGESWDQVLGVLASAAFRADLAAQVEAELPGELEWVEWEENPYHPGGGYYNPPRFHPGVGYYNPSYRRNPFIGPFIAPPVGYAAPLF